MFFRALVAFLVLPGLAAIVAPLLIATLAPWAPPKTIVVIGLNRFVRNPMYVGVLVLVLGWATFYGSWLVFGYAAILSLAFHVRLVTYEAPRLASQFPVAWLEYGNNVRPWLPRTKPWTPLKHPDETRD